MNEKSKARAKNKSNLRKYYAERCMFVRNMPPNLKAHFKARCTVRGYSMKSVLVRLMHDYTLGKIDISPLMPE